MAPTLPKLAVPKLALSKKQILIIAGAVALLAAAWLGWRFLSEDTAPPPPPAKSTPTAAKQPGPAKAAPLAGPAQDKLIDDVLIASGLKQQLNQLPGQMIAGIRESSQRKTKIPPTFAKALEQAVADSFSAQDLQDRLKADLKKHFDQRRLQALLGELSTPAGKRMVELEQVAPAREELDRFARGLTKTPLSPQRSLLLKRIDAAKRASDFAVELSFMYIDAIASAIAADEPKKPAAVAKAIEAQRAAATDNIRNATRLNLAFSYQSASDADLETYAKLAESDSAKWLTGIVIGSLLQQFKSAAALAGERIGEAASKPAAPAAKPARSKSRADARACLGLPTNNAIIKCAQEYF